MEIAHSIINNGDLGHKILEGQDGKTKEEDVYNVPLVEGITPVMRGSKAIAIRTARPKALNTVSAI
jgi:hypothetical protein